MCVRGLTAAFGGALRTQSSLAVAFQIDLPEFWACGGRHLHHRLGLRPGQVNGMAEAKVVHVGGRAGFVNVHALQARKRVAPMGAARQEAPTEEFGGLGSDGVPARGGLFLARLLGCQALRLRASLEFV